MRGIKGLFTLLVAIGWSTQNLFDLLNFIQIKTLKSFTDEKSRCILYFFMEQPINELVEMYRLQIGIKLNIYAWYLIFNMILSIIRVTDRNIISNLRFDNYIYGRTTFRPTPFCPTLFRPKLFVHSFSSNPNIT